MISFCSAGVNVVSDRPMEDKLGETLSEELEEAVLNFTLPLLSTAMTL